MSTDSSDSRDGDRFVGTRLKTPEDKQQVRVHAAQEGYSTMAAYLRHLIYEDIEDNE